MLGNRDLSGKDAVYDDSERFKNLAVLDNIANRSLEFIESAPILLLILNLLLDFTIFREHFRVL